MSKNNKDILSWLQLAFTIVGWVVIASVTWGFYTLNQSIFILLAVLFILGEIRRALEKEELRDFREKFGKRDKRS